jgi:dephospho-CoA kinase
MRIAVTGAMGTGKSTFVAWLAQHLPEYEFFNVDTLVAELYAAPDFVSALTGRFGVAERKEVSRIVFADKNELAWLEALSIQMLAPKLDDIFTRPRIVVEFPLLFEMVAPYGKFDMCIGTWCDPELQNSRIAARDGLDAEQTQRKLEAQMDVLLKASLADVLVDMTQGPGERVLDAIKQAKSRAMLKARCHNFFGTTAVWPVIEASYSDPARAAHNLDYLALVLARFDEHQMHAANPKAVELAIWFHLAGLSLFPGHYGRSPARSARLMWRVLADTAPDWLTDRETLPAASELIDSLQFMRLDHVRASMGEGHVQDGKLFLDIMFLAYAQPEDALDKHWADTHGELTAMPGLQAALPHLLLELVSRQRLLLTDALYATHEDRVRKGISYLLSQAGDDDELADDPAGPFNHELHALQDQVYSGEAFAGDAPEPASADSATLRDWPADKRSTPYETE